MNPFYVVGVVAVVVLALIGLMTIIYRSLGY